jgi:hypothetical protein
MIKRTLRGRRGRRRRKNKGGRRLVVLSGKGLVVIEMGFLRTAVDTMP